MSKLLTTLVCAFAVLAFAAPAAAEIYTVSDEDIDGFLEKLGAEDLDDDLLDSQSDGVGGGFLDSCTDCRPICYAVSFLHGSTWTVITGGDIYWDSGTQAYGVCYDEDAMTDVEGLRQSWKTVSGRGITCCSYCSSGTFDEGYYFNYPDVFYRESSDYEQCWIDAGNANITVYVAQETDYFWESPLSGDFDYNYWSFFNLKGKIGKMISPTSSTVNVANCDVP
jgi:hypothetical protein